MLDVWAHHGTSLVPFARAGWQVYAFEPDPAKPRFADYPCRLKSPRAWGNIFAVQEQEPALYQALVQSCKAQHPF
jgi:hypothetical protein